MVIPEIDIWRAASLMLKRYGDKAEQQSAARADELAAQDDHNGAAIRRRITLRSSSSQTRPRRAWSIDPRKIRSTAGSASAADRLPSSEILLVITSFITPKLITTRFNANESDTLPRREQSRGYPQRTAAATKPSAFRIGVSTYKHVLVPRPARWIVAMFEEIGAPRDRAL